MKTISLIFCHLMIPRSHLCLSHLPTYVTQIPSNFSLFVHPFSPIFPSNELIAVANKKHAENSAIIRNTLSEIVDKRINLRSSSKVPLLHVSDHMLSRKPVSNTLCLYHSISPIITYYLSFFFQ